MIQLLPFTEADIDHGAIDRRNSAIACYERVGFKREGVARDWFKADDGYWSMIVMSILEPEWIAQRNPHHHFPTQKLY